ncbi:MAG: helix-turn-helix domain-containing protein [Clostridia bacterium]|nr:helix-turn-helix domain-containing protein [Clostridia bacterium]
MKNLAPFFLEPIDEHPLTFGLHENRVTNFPLHYHPVLEIILCFDGQINLLNGDNSIPLQKNDIAVISPLVIHGYASTKKSNSCTLLFEDDLYLDVENAHIFHSAQDIHLLHNLSADRIELINDVLNHIAFCHGSKDFVLMAYYCKIFLTYLFRFVLENPLQESVRNIYSNPHIKDILIYIREHSQENVTLDTLAELVHINRYTVSKLINQHLGCTLTELINQYRLINVCHLLTTSDLPVLSISEQVGYGSLNTMSRNFVQKFGITPMEYRKQKKKPFTFLHKPEGQKGKETPNDL